MTEECGVWHPQEGVFNGHFKPTEADKINRIGQLRQGVVKVIENQSSLQTCPENILLQTLPVTVLLKCIITKTEVIKGKKAIVQGFGNVGSAAAFYLAEMGAKLSV
jgi:S-adenosylhomocysteine hydrolase